MKEYVEGLEREFSAIERGFLREQRRARSDYASFDPEQARRVAFLAYRSEVYQVRMYAVFLLGHLSQESDVLSFFGTMYPRTPIGEYKRSSRRPSMISVLSGATRRRFPSSTSG